jgi:hypothetical protein
MDYPCAAFRFRVIFVVPSVRETSAENCCPGETRMTFRRSVSVLLAAALASGLAVRPAMAAPAPVSQAAGRFLSGAANGTNFDSIAALDGESAINNGGPAVVHQRDISGSVLGQQLPKLPGGVQLPGGGVLTLGAVNQYTRADPDGSSHGASGAITNSGAIGFGGDSAPQSDSTLDLTGSANPLAALGGLKVRLGALSATAGQAKGKNGVQSGDYEIASLKIILRSPALAGAIRQLTSGSGDVPGLSGLISTLGGDGLNIRPQQNVNTPNPTTPLTSALASLGDVNFGDGAITGSLSAGALTIDVAKLLKALLNLDLNNLPPNTHLAPYIARALPQALSNGVAQLQKQLTTQFDRLALQLNKTMPAKTTQAQAALAMLVKPVTDALSTGASGLSSAVFVPLATQFESVLDPIVNVQVRSGGTFTERAIAMLLGGDAARIDLASASVGPNAGPRTPAAPHSVATHTIPSPAPAASLPNTGPDVWLTKVALFGLLGLCLGAGLVGATLGVRRMGKHPS